ncbi:hypothetical protein TH66_10875 [Carbonactinospora thermoautotrophica]|uniref:Protein-L-isoaspartate O-methyltransferase n=1 Tax=Carbonactinospora thermoautotrophica TaxID=1469144 RepID=A0A132NIR8_9ACTN|nr:hypothetical protein TH66_10875 [Carbonactinospora thermoautotrophica]KWX09945.1 hypothetical protein TR74_06585 [Carbonactinospora thermoautotrophica]
MTEVDGRAVELRRRLAGELKESGDLRSPQWRAAVEAVPRETFLHGGCFRQVPGSPTRWEPVTPDRVGVEDWLELVYSNETLVTQIDGKIRFQDVVEPVAGVPTSSSTLPGLVVRMLEELDVHDGMRVLEIGTGTGYSTALLCHRLGSQQVTTIEVDPDVAARAEAALDSLGYDDYTIITGDGLVGYPYAAPYDRIIATCSVRRVPYTWVRQTRPGGIILATVNGWLYSSGLAKLHVHEDGTAQGQFLPGTISFMLARAHIPPAFDYLDARAFYADSERPARYGPQILKEWVPRFVAQLAAPGAQYTWLMTGNSPETTYLVDVEREAFATLTPTRDGGWMVRQGGPIALWDAIEDALDVWEAAGKPGMEGFRLRITRTEQIVSIDTPTGEMSWTLP